MWNEIRSKKKRVFFLYPTKNFLLQDVTTLNLTALRSGVTTNGKTFSLNGTFFLKKT